MRIVGLDLSLTGTGICATTTTNPDATFVETIATNLRGHARLDAILREIAEWTRAADLVVVEGPSYGSQRGQSGHHERAGLWWLVAHDLLWRKQIPYAVVSPTQRAQYATGKGNASKDAVLSAAIRRYPRVQFDDNNAADALVLAAMACDFHGFPLAQVPASHRAALAKVEWPDVAAPPSEGVA